MQENKKKYASDLKTAITRYCDYQERCHQEVRNKLYEIGATTPEVEHYISLMIEEGLLNEERYAKAFARGRFRLKKWGKIKIIQQLKLHKVSVYCIKSALQEIDPDEYDRTLILLTEKKWDELKGEKNQPAKKNKVYRYLAQKGYESDLIFNAINLQTNK